MIEPSTSTSVTPKVSRNPSSEETKKALCGKEREDYLAIIKSLLDNPSSPELLYFRDFKIHHANVNGLKIRTPDIRFHLDTCKPHLLFISETRLGPPSKGDNETKYNHPGYALEHKFKAHAGVCVYIRKDVYYQRLIDKENEDFNVIWILIDHGVENGCYVGLYRSHDSQLKTTIEKNYKMNRLYSYLCATAESIEDDYNVKPCFYTGDFNAKEKTWLPPYTETDDAGEYTLKFANDLHLTQLVKETTRVPYKKGEISNCLDLILTTHPCRYKERVSAPLGTADHSLVSAITTFPTFYDSPKYLRLIWNFEAAKWDDMRLYLIEFYWDVAFSSDDATLCADSVVDVILQAMEYFIPSSFVSSTLEWTQKCVQAENSKEVAFREYQNNKCEDKRKKYRTAAEKSSKVIVLEFNSFEQLSSILSLPKLKKPDDTMTDITAEKVDLLVDAFAKKVIFYKVHVSSPAVSEADSSEFEVTINDTDVTATLLSLEDSILSGPNTVPGIVLKNSAPAKVFAEMFSRCYKQGIVPNNWKVYHLHPKIVKGSSDNPANYAPINMQNSLSKLMEEIMRNKIEKHLSEKLDMRFYVYGKFFFNVGDYLSIDNEKLFAIFNSYGVPKEFCDWLTNWQNKRSIRVVSDGFASKIMPIENGLPLDSELTYTLLPVIAERYEVTIEEILHLAFLTLGGTIALIIGAIDDDISPSSILKFCMSVHCLFHVLLKDIIKPSISVFKINFSFEDNNKEHHILMIPKIYAFKLLVFFLLFASPFQLSHFIL